MKWFAVTIIFVAGFNTFVYSQLCTGSLGDPLVDITFGYGTNPGPALPAGQTVCTYSGSGCPNRDEYSLLNLTFGCFENSWQTVSGDHTPNDGGGYYMLVNASGGKKDLFVYTVTGLCENTTYEFAAWMKNVLRSTACEGNGVHPNLTFKIETASGTELASYNSGDIAEEEDPTWRQYGLLFKTSPGLNSVVLRITDISGSGCGNALALDDITLRACGPQVTAKIVSTGMANAEVCDGDKTAFVFSAGYGSGFTNPVFQWQILGDGLVWLDIPGANFSTLPRQPTGTGVYTYRMIIAEAGSYSSPSCRIASNEISISVLHAPFVQSTNYVYGCLGGDITLFASGARNYVWTGPNGFTTTAQSFILPTVQYSDAGMYRVTGTTDLGCSNSDSTLLKVFPNATASSSAGGFICEGASVMLQAGGGVRYSWYPVEGLSNDTIATPYASPVENISYQVKVTNQYGCSDTANIKINVWKKPVANAGPDLKTRLGIPIVLKGTANGSDVNSFWTPSDNPNATPAFTPVINPPRTTSYTFHVVSPHGCPASTDEVLVKVYDKILIPNAFSPNGDGINDTWFIDPLYMFENANLEVYNRYGQIVYRSRGYNTPWNGTSNGKPVPQGTYYYIIDLKVPKEPNLIGSITILR